MNHSEKNQTLRWLGEMHEKFGQEIATHARTVRILNPYGEMNYSVDVHKQKRGMRTAAYGITAQTTK